MRDSVLVITCLRYFKLHAQGLVKFNQPCAGDSSDTVRWRTAVAPHTATSHAQMIVACSCAQAKLDSCMQQTHAPRPTHLLTYSSETCCLRTCK